MPGRRRSLCAAFIALLLAAFGAAESRAVTYYWDADAASTAATGGTGNWDMVSSLWRAGSSTGTLGMWPGAGGDNDANLGGTTGTGILTLTTGISINDITVAPSSGTAYVIAGAAQTLTLNGTSQSVLDVASSKTLTITSGLAGLNGFTKSSAGTLILDSVAGTDTLFGDITVNGGTLQAGSATNNGASQVLRSNAVTLAGGTSLTTVGTTADLRVGSLSGSGSVTPATGGAINVLALADATFSGTITTTGGLNLRGNNGTTQTFSGNATALTGTIGINSGATLLLMGTGSTSGVIGGSTIALRGGNFTMDNSGGNTSAAAGRLSDSATVTFLGGTFSLIGNSAGTSETVGAPTFSGGSNTISVTNNGGSGAQLTFTKAAGSWRDQTRMVINFVGAGTGTLGLAGNNPRITSTGTPTTITGGGSAPFGMLSDTATGATVGWATVNGTEWAGYGANGIIAVTPGGTSTTATDLGFLTAGSVAVFSPTTTVTSGPVTTGTLKITPNGGTTLAMGSNALTTTALMLAGATDFSITGTGTYAGSATRYVHVTDAGTTLSMSSNVGGSAQPLTKAGPGFLSLNGASNQLGFSSVQNINLVAGVLRGTTTTLGGGTSAGGPNTTINFRGGVLEISGGGTFVRAIDLAGTASGGGVSFDGGGTDRGDGGFSAINGNAIITLVTAVGGATAASLVWNDNAFLSNGYILLLGSTKADSRVDLTNDIGLDNGTATNYFAREFRVPDNTLSSTDLARLSGVISGSANADLVKTGGGLLELTGTNTYFGSTHIQAGTLSASGGSAIPNTSAVVLANTAGATFQLNASETIGTLAGGGATGGNVNIQTSTLTLGDQRDSTFAGVISGGGGAVVKQGTGVITFTGANTFTGGTTLSAGTVVAGNDSALGNSGAQTVTFNGGRLASDNDVRSLPNNLTVNNVAGNQVTGTNSVTLTGTAGGTGTLEVALTTAGKSVTVNPSAANSFAPDMLRLTSGTLLLGGSNKIGDSTKMSFSGGALGLNNFSEGAAGSAGVGSMSLSATSILDYGTLGAGANAIAFGGVGSHTAATVLQVTNYDIGTDHLYFTGATSDFSSAFAPTEVSFNGTLGYAAISFSGYYEIVAVPEPTTVLGALGLLAFLAYRERRRVSRLWSLHVSPPLILLGFLLVSFVTKDTD